VTSSAKRPRAAIEAAATNPAIAAIKSAASMGASAAVKTASATAMKPAASAPMKTAASTVTAAAVLSECWICCECKTDESSKCDERSTECGHNLYLPANLGAQFRASSPL
jgi:hypothetical protein